MPPVDPRGMSLESWAAFLVQDYGSDFLPILVPAEIMKDPDRWRDWAMRVIEALRGAERGAGHSIS